MADYGYYKKKKRGKPRLSWWWAALRILDAAMLVGTLLCSAVLLMAFLARYIDPSKGTVFAFAGLVFPVFYVAEIIAALYWVMRWKRWAIVAAAVLLLCIGNARLFYRLNIMERYENEKPLKTELVVMTYNVMQFKYPSQDGRSPEREIAELARDNNVDILCMQEFDNTPAIRKTIDSVLTDLRYTYFRHYVLSVDEEDARGLGLAIYSRYPIVARGVVDADPGKLRSIWADIRIKRDTVRVVNNHLQNTNINDNDVDYLSSFRLRGSLGLRQIAQIAGKLKDNYILRAPQARRIGEFIAGSPHPAIVCGDLNDTPVSYAYRSISRGLKDAFVMKGRGSTSGTYNGFFNMFRIDYIFVSDGVEVSRYYPFGEVYSDHDPVAASFYFSQR